MLLAQGWGDGANCGRNLCFKSRGVASHIFVVYSLKGYHDLFFHHQRNKLNCSPAMKCRIDLGAPLNAFLCLWVVEVHCKIPPFHTSSAKNLKCSCECWCYYSCILSMRIFSHTCLFSASTGCSFVRVHLPLQHTEQSSWKKLIFRWFFFYKKTPCHDLLP